MSDSFRSHRPQPTRLLPWDFPGKNEYWIGLPFPSPEDLPHPGIEPGSPALQADTLPSEPPGSLVILVYIIKYLLSFKVTQLIQVRKHYMCSEERDSKERRLLEREPDWVRIIIFIHPQSDRKMSLWGNRQGM